MGIQNVNNAAPKTIADFNADDLKNADEKKFQNTIFDLDQAVRNDVTIDGKLEGGEKPKIQQWLSLIDNMFVNVSDNVKEKCEHATETALKLIKDLCKEAGIKKYDNEKGIVFENNEAEYYTYEEEPSETDTERYNPFVYISEMSDKEIKEKIEELRVPEGKFELIEAKNKVEDIKQKYNKCFNLPTKENRNGRIAANLKTFLAYCYAEDVLQDLKNIRSSIGTDGRLELNNIEDQINSQIHFYEELAEREKQENKQIALNAALKPLERPSEEKTKAYAKAMEDTHSHNGVDDLKVLGYSAENAKALLYGPKPVEVNRTLTRRLD